MGAEVDRCILVCFCQGAEFIEGRREPLDTLFSETDKLYGVGVELGGEFSGGVTVGDQVEVTPEQVLDEIVRVDQERGGHDRSLCAVSEWRTGRDQHRVAGGSERGSGAAGVKDQRAVTDEHESHAVERNPWFTMTACECPNGAGYHCSLARSASANCGAVSRYLSAERNYWQIERHHRGVGSAS